ncbi:DNA excision repair protein ERCC-1 isoform X4 [Solenopsis invicta]|uniref:DNA excision repair protein ERCC-1 isoform X4 n=1 Tax=Solenopsis invicta TaxID=13686 RepID=UPI00193EB46A|nr:DNA excision repair protein ERCC-1 isoform X4 [Solenopsis invicta]
MNNTNENTEDLDNVSPSKQAKNTSFQSAFSNLKKSEFFKDLSESKPETSVTATSNKINTVFVNPKQRGNPLLKFITNVSWEYSDIVPDYVMGKTTCALFLSIRYHQLNPDYIHERLKLLDMTLMLAWNAEDAGKIIETYKMYESKPSDDIMERSDTAPHQKLVNALTTIRSVNKTDATTLLTTFGTLADIVRAQPNTLALCSGFGLHKAQKLHKVLHESFLRPPNHSTK